MFGNKHIFKIFLTYFLHISWLQSSDNFTYFMIIYFILWLFILPCSYNSFTNDLKIFSASNLILIFLQAEIRKLNNKITVTFFLVKSREFASELSINSQIRDSHFIKELGSQHNDCLVASPGKMSQLSHWLIVSDFKIDCVFLILSH